MYFENISLFVGGVSSLLTIIYLFLSSNNVSINMTNITQVTIPTDNGQIEFKTYDVWAGLNGAVLIVSLVLNFVNLLAVVTWVSVNFYRGAKVINHHIVAGVSTTDIVYE